MEAADSQETHSTSPEQQINNSKLGFRDAAFILTPMLIIVLAELLLYSGKTQTSVYIHVFTLIALASSTIWSSDQIVYKTHQALMLLPLLRLVNISMPVFFEMTLYSFVFIYVPLTVPIYLVLSHQKFTAAQIGLTTKNIIRYLPVAVLMGLIIGEGEYLIIASGYLIPDLSIVSILKLSVVMILFVGLVEELIFRSILQTKLEENFGMLPGLIGASFMFGIMHSGYGTPYEILYTASAGLVIGWLFQKTRSLPLIAIVHGCVNIFLFGLIPHLGVGLGLF